MTEDKNLDKDVKEDGKITCEGSESNDSGKLGSFDTYTVLLLVMILCITTLLFYEEKKERLVEDIPTIAETLIEESIANENVENMQIESEVASEITSEITSEVASEVNTEHVSTAYEMTKEDVSNETHSIIMEDYSKEKATLINIHNKLVGVYSSEEWVYMPEGIGDDTLGFEMGIKRDMYKTFFCKKSLDDFTSDIFLGVCAQDGKAEEVKKQLYKYKDKLTIEFESVPAEIERIQSADIIQHGNYVYFILLGKIDKTASAEQVREQQKLNNKKAVEVVSNDLNYENVPEDIKEDRKFQMISDVGYEINIPEIKSKPQNISSETEEDITPEESEQAEIEETQESNLSEETISN